MASTRLPTDKSLHPEIRSIVSLATAHTQKVYFSGPLVYTFERRPDGCLYYEDNKGGDWRNVWAQLSGTTLSIWNTGERKMVRQPRVGKHPSSSVDVTEPAVQVLGTGIIKFTRPAPHFCGYFNIIALNTGVNRHLFSCPSSRDFVSWVAAFRLSRWEKSRLEEIYTAYLIQSTISDGRNALSTLTRGRLEGWVKVRIADLEEWKRLWMCISVRAITNTTRRDPRGIPNDFPGRANISFYNSPHRKKNLVLKVRTVTQAFAVYPGRPNLISNSTLIKLEGTFSNEGISVDMERCEGWMLLMPDSEGAGSEEMLRWLIAIHDAFELYGRPEKYSWNPEDPVSMMFACPTGPEKHLLFLDRELAEGLDRRGKRTSVVRSKLHNIVVQRMKGRKEASGPSNSPIAPTNAKTLRPVPLPQTDPHPNSTDLSPTLTTSDPPPALTYTTTTTSKNRYTKYSSGVEPSPRLQTPRASSSRNHPNPGSYSQPRQRQYNDGNSDTLAPLTFLERDEANATSRLSPPQESGGPMPNMEADGYDTTTTSASESACGRLIRRAFAPHELPSLVEAIFSSNDAGDTIRSLIGDDAQTFVDVINEALDIPKLSSRIRKRCLKSLYSMCGRHALLPRALKISVCYDRTGPALYRGGFADVWKGQHCGRDVAVKVIRIYSDDDLQKIIGRFCKEVMAWKTLRHPNILPLIGVMVSQVQFAMISDWMVNGNINDFVKAHPDANRLELLKDVAQGLIYIHDQGMIHGDLKGANILIDQTGHARLADFGLLTIITDPTNLLTSTTYSHGGTARWMSPELIDPQQFGLESSRPTESSDCYALGMVIYETISGNPPFHGDTDLTVLAKVLQRKHPPRGAKFGKDLWRMLERCWESQPSSRPSIGEVLRCLEALSKSP